MKLTKSQGVLDIFFFGKTLGKELAAARKPIQRNEKERQAAHTIRLLERSNEPPPLSAEDQYYIAHTKSSSWLPAQVWEYLGIDQLALIHPRRAKGKGLFYVACV